VLVCEAEIRAADATTRSLYSERRAPRKGDVTLGSAPVPASKPALPPPAPKAKAGKGKSRRKPKGR
jgi:hypothetical protein